MFGCWPLLDFPCVRVLFPDTFSISHDLGGHLKMWAILKRFLTRVSLYSFQVLCVSSLDQLCFSQGKRLRNIEEWYNFLFPLRRDSTSKTDEIPYSFGSRYLAILLDSFNVYILCSFRSVTWSTKRCRTWTAT